MPLLIQCWSDDRSRKREFQVEDTLLDSKMSLMSLIQKLGMPVGSSCGGESQCGWCRVRVLKGAEVLNAPTELERAYYARQTGGENEELVQGFRLSCQAYIQKESFEQEGAELWVSTTYW